MRRSEFPTLNLLTLDQLRGVVAYGSLAVSASDMYRSPWELDILQELTDPPQTGLDHGRLWRVLKKHRQRWSETRFLHMVLTHGGDWTRSCRQERLYRNRQLWLGEHSRVCPRGPVVRQLRP